MANGLITFNQYVQEKGFDNKTVNRFWKYCNQDIPNKETGQIEWWGRDVTNYNDMVGYSEEFDNLFEEFKNINSSRRNNMIKSSITKDEYFNMVKKHKSTNASTPEFRKQELDAITAFPVGTKFAFKEDNSWHDVNTVYEKIDDNVWKITQVINGKVNDEYTKSDDEVRIYISDEFGGNAHPTSYVSGYGSINSSKRNNMIKSDKQFRLIDTEHNDPKDGEDFTAEELRDYISKNDKYFDDVGLDYTIVDLNTGEEMNISTFRLNSSRQVKSTYTREDYDRFDEYGEYIPYKPTEEELAKKDEIKTVLRQELSDAYEPDPMDDYVGYDSTNERIDMACERVAKQFGVDTDFVEDIAGEIDRENIARSQAEPEYVYQHCKDKDRFWDWYNGEDVSLEELGIDKEQMDREVNETVRKYVNSSRQITSAKSTKKSIQDWIESEMTDEIKEDVYNFFKTSDKYYLDDVITLNQFENIMFKNGFDDQGYMWKESINSSRKPIKSSIITPWDINQVSGTSDEDLGLSAVVDMYGNEFVNVDESTLNELKDTLVRYFDDEAYVRDWNINNPDYQIEEAFEVTDPEEMNVEDLARYFDYEAYGRDIRLEDNMVWDSENQYWVSAHDVDDEELNDDKYIFMRG